MAKRLTDTDKWKDGWFLALDHINREFWLYILDNCNHAGIWKVAWPLVEYVLGGRPSLEHFKGRLHQLNEDTYFVPGFLLFQYGDTWDSDKIPARRAVTRDLESKGLMRIAKRLTSDLIRSRYCIDTVSTQCRYPANNNNNNNNSNSNSTNQGNSKGNNNKKSLGGGG